MTKEEAIEQLKMRLKPNTYGGECALGYNKKYCFGKSDLEAIEKVLNMLKENSAEIHQKNTELAEKNAEIEKYKKLLADNLAKELNNSIKAKEKADTDLNDLDKGWKVELEKKDKMIDLILDFIYDIWCVCPVTTTHELDVYDFNVNQCADCEHLDKKCKSCLKQHFERKAEEN